MSSDSKEEPQLLWMAAKPPRGATKPLQVIRPVIGCLVVVSGLAFTIPSFFHTCRDASPKLAQAAVDANGPIATAVKLYKMDVGHYPGSLAELATPGPVGKGPYMEDNSKFSDPWGHPLLYRCPGVHNPGSYDLWSAGRDGVDGTADDIVNWKL